jgi:nucleoside 2-deoxyribosyltransferase
MKLYLAGPMRGRAYYNAGTFAEVAWSLRSFGYDVITPIEVDRTVDPAFDHYRNKATAEQVARFQAASIKAMLACDGVALLPCWRSSQGTLREIDAAVAHGLRVADAFEWIEFAKKGG